MLEIKSGNDYKSHAAMNRALKVENWKFDKNIVFSKYNVETDEKILYLPWYMIMFLTQNKTPKEMIYKVDISNL